MTALGRVALLLILSVALTSARADESAGAVRDSAVGGGDAFLSLPAYDLDCAKDPSGAARVGEPIRCRIHALAPEGVSDPTRELRIEEPGVARDPLEVGWKIVPVDPATLGETEKKELQEHKDTLLFSVVALKPGRHELPSLGIRDASGKSLARTNPFTFEAKSTLESTDPKAREAEDIRDPVIVSLPRWVIAVFAAIALLLVAVFGHWAWRRIQEIQAARARKPEIPKSEDEIALIELVELEKLALWKSEAFKKHYFRVSEILKKYFSARYEFDAQECTTEEMVEAFQMRHDLAKVIVERIRLLFTEKLDPVKFADRIPGAGEPEWVLSEARRIVRETAKPRPVIASVVPTSAQAGATGGPASGVR